MELVFDLSEISQAATTFLLHNQQFKIFAFHGNLGAGKTTFIKALAKQLSVQENISSPTYSIIHQYKTITGNTIYHMDLYRLKDLEEALQAGVEDCIYSGDLCFIEWPEKISSILPSDTIQIFLEIESATKRKLVCKLPE